MNTTRDEAAEFNAFLPEDQAQTDAWRVGFLISCVQHVRDLAAGSHPQLVVIAKVAKTALDTVGEP